MHRDINKHSTKEHELCRSKNLDRSDSRVFSLQYIMPVRSFAK